LGCRAAAKVGAVTVKLSIPEPAAGANLPRYLDAFADPDTAESYWVFHRAAARIALDAEVTELIRLRNAVVQSCKWCLSARRADAWQGDGDAADVVMRFEQGDLPERLKAGLRLGAAFLAVPGELTDEAKTAALEHFTPEEIVGMLFRLVMNTWDKVPIALGLDQPIAENALTYFDYRDDGNPVLVS
jgi:alkylhydroperoxidase family enzyme